MFDLLGFNDIRLTEGVRQILMLTLVSKEPNTYPSDILHGLPPMTSSL